MLRREPTRIEIDQNDINELDEINKNILRRALLQEVIRERRAMELSESLSSRQTPSPPPLPVSAAAQSKDALAMLRAGGSAQTMSPRGTPPPPQDVGTATPSPSQAGAMASLFSTPRVGGVNTSLASLGPTPTASPDSSPGSTSSGVGIPGASPISSMTTGSSVNGGGYPDLSGYITPPSPSNDYLMTPPQSEMSSAASRLRRGALPQASSNGMSMSPESMNSSMSSAGVSANASPAGWGRAPNNAVPYPSPGASPSTSVTSSNISASPSAPNLSPASGNASHTARYGSPVMSGGGTGTGPQVASAKGGWSPERERAQQEFIATLDPSLLAEVVRDLEAAAGLSGEALRRWRERLLAHRGVGTALVGAAGPKSSLEMLGWERFATVVYGGPRAARAAGVTEEMYRQIGEEPAEKNNEKEKPNDATTSGSSPPEAAAPTPRRSRRLAANRAAAVVDE